MFRRSLLAALVAALSLLFLLFACPRGAVAAPPRRNPPTCSVQLIHNAYQWGVGTAYVGDDLRFWWRLRYHTDSEAVTTTTDAWNFTRVDAHWIGEEWDCSPFDPWVPFGRYMSYIAGSGWHPKVTSHLSSVITDGYQDIACYFGFVQNAAMPPPCQMSSSILWDFHWNHTYVFPFQGGWMPGNEDYSINYITSLDQNTPPVPTLAARGGKPSARRMYAVGKTRQVGEPSARLVSFTPVPMAKPCGAERPCKRIDGTLQPFDMVGTATQQQIDLEMSDSVLSGINSVTTGYYNSYPNFYTQDGQQATITWPNGTPY